MSYVAPLGYVNPDRKKKYHWTLDVPNMKWYPPRECHGSACRVCHLPKGILPLNKSGSNIQAVIKSLIVYNKKHGEVPPNNYFPKKITWPNITMGRKAKVQIEPEPMQYSGAEATMPVEPEAVSEAVAPAKKRGRPKKASQSSGAEPSQSSEPIQEPVEPAQSSEPLPEPVEVKTETVSRRKYGNCTEVWHGLFPQTRSGLTKADMMMTPKGKIVTKKQYENLKASSDRLKSLKVNKEVAI